MQPPRLVVHSVCPDDHRGREVGGLEQVSPAADHLAVASEDDRLGRVRRDIRCDLPSTVVGKRLGDEMALDYHRSVLVRLDDIAGAYCSMRRRSGHRCICRRSPC